MRTLKFFALVGIFSAFLRPEPTLAKSNHQLSDAFPNYVVIGAFKYQRNAVRFTTHASKDRNMNAKYEMNQNRKLYYVYVLNTSDRAEAISEAMRLRSDSEFKDTWVYCGSLGKLRPGQENIAGVDINPMTANSIEEVVSTEKVSSASTETVPENSTPPVTSKPAAEEPDSEIAGKQFFFQLSRATDSQPVEGDVDVIDIDKVKKIGTYKGNMDVRVSKPSGKSGNVSLVCEVFGYRKVQRDVNFEVPADEDIKTTESGAVAVPFQLTRLQKGDIAVMYNVYFFKDAAIMRPESRYEVTSLLDMLKENPNYKIKIHGHTNGKASGRIIMLEEGNTNPFSLNQTRDAFGSAKKLSEERANVIKSYLVNNGIETSRMVVKAWGGKRPIHDKHSSRAQENVRVEIEILED